MFAPYGLMTVGEMSSTSLDHCRRYARLDGKELSMTFNFHHLKVDYPGGAKWTRAKPDLIMLKRIFQQWQQGMHGQAWNALFWCNHDQPRVVSRLGNDGELREVSAKMLAMVLHGMQGTPFIYQGEEIAMTNPHFADIRQYRDLESLNMFHTLRRQGTDDEELLAILAQKSRDNGRTPMQWDASRNAGFTEGDAWIDPAANYREINVERALNAGNSVLFTYKRLIALRKQYEIITWGDYGDLAPEHPALWCYERRWGTQRLLVMANLGCEHLPLEEDFLADKGQQTLLLSNYSSDDPAPDARFLRPYEAAWWLLSEDKQGESRPSRPTVR